MQALHMKEYYVYVYIDPRNFEEFYYGKGKGSRKDVHQYIDDGSEKSKRIKEIKKLGLRPIIRVIAANLTQDEALLIETTLIWKLGKHTANIAEGHFSGKFRPHNTLHQELSGYDYRNGLYYYNVGESSDRHRVWEDYLDHSFISGGQGRRWRDAMMGFIPGDVFTAYLKGHGYVGIGRIKTSAKMIRDVAVGGHALLDLPLRSKTLGDNSRDPDLSEYVCLVEWLRTVDRDKAKPARKADGVFTTTHVRASLDGQPKTIEYLCREFQIDLTKEIV